MFDPSRLNDAGGVWSNKRTDHDTYWKNAFWHVVVFLPVPIFSSHTQHSWDFADNYSKKLRFGSDIPYCPLLFYYPEVAEHVYVKFSLLRVTCLLMT